MHINEMALTLVSKLCSVACSVTLGRALWISMSRYQMWYIYIYIKAEFLRMNLITTSSWFYQKICYIPDCMSLLEIDTFQQVERDMDMEREILCCVVHTLYRDKDRYRELLFSIVPIPLPGPGPVLCVWAITEWNYSFRTWYRTYVDHSNSIFKSIYWNKTNQ